MRFTPSTHIISLLTLLVAMALAAPLFGQRTTRRGLRPSVVSTESAQQQQNDTVACTPDEVLLSITGFDKPLRSRVETMFVTNRMARQLRAVEFTIDYFDLSGRKLHSRTLTVAADIPPGETRQISFPTFDRQQSFYYRKSSKPRRADGTPFEVAVTLLRVVCAPVSETTSSAPSK